MKTIQLDEPLLIPPAPQTIVRPAYEVASDYVPVLRDYVTFQLARERAQRDDDMQLFCERVASKLNNVCKCLQEITHNPTIDGVHVWSQEFFSVFCSAGREYVANADAQKREYLIAFVANYGKHHRPDVTMVQIFWSLIRELSGTHLVVLSVLHEAQKALSKEDLSSLRPQRNEAVSMKALSTATNIPLELVEVIVQTIGTRGLARRSSGPTVGSDLSERVILEGLGLQFMAFLSGSE